MRLHFNAALVQRLFDHSQSATERSPSLEQLLEGRFRRDGRDVELEGLDAQDFPTADDVDPTKIPPGLWLVGDEGIYLMSNGRPALLVDPDGTRHLVAYAGEATPSALAFDDWRETKRTAFGREDGAVFLDVRFIAGLLGGQAGGRACLDLTPERAEAVLLASPLPVAKPFPRRRRHAVTARRA